MRHWNSIIAAVALAAAMGTCGLKGCDGPVTYPECFNYTKNGVHNVTSKPMCRTACETAEGLSPVTEDFKNKSGSFQCACVLPDSSNRILCEDSDYGKFKIA
eukprot:Skav235678  [mRNA]  locus=scaffold358:1242626:1242931:- [translate_table: standard]